MALGALVLAHYRPSVPLILAVSAPAGSGRRTLCLALGAPAPGLGRNPVSHPSGGDEVLLVSGFDLPLWGKEGVQPFVPSIGISEAFAKTGSATQNCQFSEIW